MRRSLSCADSGSPGAQNYRERALCLSATNSLRLTNGLVVQCFPCTLKSMRGFSIPVAVMDEVAYFRLEGQAGSDVKIQTSIRRGMVGFTSGTKLIEISTPYMQGGVLYDDFQRAFGKPDPDLLVWRATSRLMNPAGEAHQLSTLDRMVQDLDVPLREQRLGFEVRRALIERGAWRRCGRGGRHVLRMSAGVVLIVVGVIGIVLPVIPGIPLLAVGLALVAPDHPLLRWGRVRLARWFEREAGPP